MQYLEFRFEISPKNPWDEILIAELAEVGFDSFTEDGDAILAYIPKNEFDRKSLDSLNIFQNDSIEISYDCQEMPDINWNEEWEKNFEPIVVEDKVLIRAEFHEPQPEMHEIVIQPKMSFGTGHHPTTYLMLRQMLQMDFAGKTVLDMGCGTSVLAIFAKQQGAEKVLAIDIDEWSVENSRENAARNRAEIEIQQGTAENLGTEKFDIILANINRNILISDIPAYTRVLNSGGQLLLSGICYFDEADILEVCTANALTFNEKHQKEEWISLLLEN